MAGIGIQLERLIDRDTVTSDLLGRIGAMVLFCGPWFFGTMGMAWLYMDLRRRLPGPDQVMVLSVLTYSYMGAMLIPSLLTLPSLRHVADRLYARDSGALAPSFVGTWLLHALASLVAGTALYAHADLPGPVRVLGVLLLVATTQLWLAGSFASCLRDHRMVLAAFASGHAAGAVLAPWLGRESGAVGYLLGCWLGLAGAALALTGALLLRFPMRGGADFGFLQVARRRPAIAWVGFFLVAGCWIDKAIFWWFSNRALWTVPWLRYNPDYDATAFLGMLTALPGMAWVLLQVETEFASACQDLVRKLVTRAPYSALAAARAALVCSMNRTVQSLCLIQGPIALLAVWYAPDLVRNAGLPPPAVHLLRFHIIAAMGLVALQVQTLFLLYFDMPERAISGAAVFWVASAALAVLTVRLGYSWWGLGFAAATWGAAVVQALEVRRVAHRLDFLVLQRCARHSLSRWIGR